MMINCRGRSETCLYNFHVTLFIFDKIIYICTLN
jgi:hypothetical protein